MSQQPGITPTLVKVIINRPQQAPWATSIQTAARRFVGFLVVISRYGAKRNAKFFVSDSASALNFILLFAVEQKRSPLNNRINN